MMTSSNGNIFRVTGPLCGEFTGPTEFPSERPVTRSFDVFFDLRLNKRLSKAGDFRRHRVHYDVTVMCVTAPRTNKIVQSVHNSAPRAQLVYCMSAPKQINIHYQYSFQSTTMLFHP